MTLDLAGISRDYGGGEGLRPSDLQVAEGEVLVLLGPSGSGKSTLLRIVAGFEAADSGVVRIDGIDVTGDPPEKRPTAMVFQHHALWPHLSVADNIGYGLKVRRMPRAAVAERVEELLSLVQLPGMGRRRPAQLSGGQRQRVALARALAVRPRLLLLDEPLAALDARLRDELRRLLGALGTTAVYVTHDHVDALELGDRVGVLRDGRLVQIGTPEEVYERPADAFVARFCGDAVLLPVRQVVAGRAAPAQVVLDDGTALPVAGMAPGTAGGTPAAVAIRPEAIKVHEADEEPTAGAGVLSGVVAGRRYADGRVRLQVKTTVGTVVTEAPLPGPDVGAQVRLGLPAERCWVVPSG